MADFHQNGNITTLHDLRHRSDNLAHEVSVLARLA